MWTANLFQVTSGSIGPQLNFESHSWSVSLNKTEEFSVNLRKSDLPKVDYDTWLAPWWAGVVLFWDGYPIVAGPIISRPNEDFDSVSLSCLGIRAVLSRRIAVTEMSDWSKLAKSTIKYTGMSLGTIAKRVIERVQEKPGGNLPITYPVADEFTANDANHQRTYQGFNVQNINADDILTKLANVINGPDFMFKPRLLSPSQLTFDMWHGTEKNTRIFQNNTPIWDSTAAFGAVVGAQTIMSGDQQTSRVFSLGAGMDQGQIITVATNNGPLVRGFPLLETTINSGNSENKNVVAQHGTAKLSNNAGMKQQLQLTVRADDTVNYLSTFWPGDLVKIHVAGWISLPNGTSDYRLLNMNGDESANVRLSLQPESQFMIDELDITQGSDV